MSGENCSTCNNTRQSDNGLICVRYPPHVLPMVVPQARPGRVMLNQPTTPMMQLMVAFPVVNELMLCREYQAQEAANT